MSKEDINQNNDGERLVTQQEARVVFRLTPMMLQHIKPIGYYFRVGTERKVYIYRLSDVQVFLDSEAGKQMLKDAETRRQRFYNGVSKRVEQYRDRLRKACEETYYERGEENGDKDKCDTKD